MGVVATLHQPSSQMWDLFDRIVLMHDGEVVYNAQTKDFYKHLSMLGISL